MDKRLKHAALPHLSQVVLFSIRVGICNNYMAVAILSNFFSKFSDFI